MTDIANSIKRAIIEQELTMWRNSQYQLTIRHKVQQKLDNKEQVKAVESELEKCEIAIDVLQAELKGLEKTNE